MFRKLSFKYELASQSYNQVVIALLNVEKNDGRLKVVRLFANKDNGLGLFAVAQKVNYLYCNTQLLYV